MTMVPTQSPSNSKQHRYGGCGGYSISESLGLMSRLEGYDSGSEACRRSDPVIDDPMAEDESRTESVNEAGSSSKDVQDERDEGWLQLGLGGHTSSHESKLDREDRRTERGRLVELDLLPPPGSTQLIRPIPPEFRAPRPVSNLLGSSSYNSSVFLQQARSRPAMFPLHQEINWAFRPVPQSVAVGSSSSSSSSSFLLGPYLTQPFGAHVGVGVAGASSDFRVIDPPPRPHSGIWFMLQASQHQAIKPFLPQIPKSYMRIKDGRMTIRLLMKYLVNKLSLDSESEIEITCKGQKLVPLLTLQHVRDNIWSPRNAVTLLANSSTTDHVMVLQYSRSA
ncbi:uncharacterized protein LOC127796297 isoform X1 [Diospyros lotus]|uniref:uncharacterized protein LOC127796297 isoform X1 n=1 Tax=Diospyros lotus TaxID=55363 RepID=UPI002255D59F|nr:uncharacterized protein LOC127796297 isoform X1 [Diospyros lotus]